MEVGHFIRFSSTQHPFLVEITPCLDLDCPCTVAELTLTEVDPSNANPHERKTFTLRVCLKTWVEQDPPQRSLEMESLVREFLARFPAARIHELDDEFHKARAVKTRFQTLSLTGPPDELVSFSSVIQEGGGIREGGNDLPFFLVVDDREFLVEDHYCANPQCDCHSVHLEFWERVHEWTPKHCIHIRQRLAASFSLDGELNEVRSTKESSSTTDRLLQAWHRHCGDQLAEFRRRYHLLKKIGARSFPTKPRSVRRVDAAVYPPFADPVSQFDPLLHVSRNAPCPCGSGLKFKRCCARHVAP